jgi:succinate dehydrogenase / fumarate reductase cytochrome b subunit
MAEARRPQRRMAKTPYWPAHYRTGMWAFVLHRFTGLLLVGYLFLHIWVISSVTVSGGTFDDVMRFLQQPLFIFLDVGLLAAVAFHGLNGVRILLFDMGVGIGIQKHLFWAAFGIATAVTLYAFYEVQPYIFGKSLT